MVLVVSRSQVKSVLKKLNDSGERAWEIGKVLARKRTCQVHVSDQFGRSAVLEY